MVISENLVDPIFCIASRNYYFLVCTKQSSFGNFNLIFLCVQNSQALETLIFSAGFGCFRFACLRPYGSVTEELTSTRRGQLVYKSDISQFVSMERKKYVLCWV